MREEAQTASQNQARLVSTWCEDEVAPSIVINVQWNLLSEPVIE